MTTLATRQTVIRAGNISFLLTCVGMAMAAETSDSKNQLERLNDANITNDTSSAAEVTGDLNQTGKSVSVFVWGPVMAIILGIVVGWMIIAINKGGVFAAINSILALIFAAVGITLTYKYLIAA